MTEWVSERRIRCPFCGESMTVVVDVSAGSQSYIEDCEICCRPMQISTQVDGHALSSIEVDRGD